MPEQLFRGGGKTGGKIGGCGKIGGRGKISGLDDDGFAAVSESGSDGGSDAGPDAGSDSGGGGIGIVVGPPDSLGTSAEQTTTATASK